MIPQVEGRSVHRGHKNTGSSAISILNITIMSRPPSGTGTKHYLCDCETSADAACQPGSDSLKRSSPSRLRRPRLAGGESAALRLRSRTRVAGIPLIPRTWRGRTPFQGDLLLLRTTRLDARADGRLAKTRVEGPTRETYPDKGTRPRGRME